MIEVVCVDCGKKFELEQDGEVFTPANCPSCNMTINSITKSAKSEYHTARS